jgi:NAD(P)-dependent dehydrogenase (short-subunit alcohol dehydrogenase family)
MVTHVRHTIDRFSVVQRSVLVTGATGALGSAAASALAAPGARLTPAGRLDGVLVPPA